ncbi:MAG: bifunctional riboflavin kinase/FAD synthetase [Bacteroidia bacterium]|nr:bifunctional riboflavin kinase/FAD synthetase [Bacteroidia bacterium]
MQIVKNLEDFKETKPIVLTQGTFDGVHLGHQKILKRVVDRAREVQGKSVLLTFYPHPRLVLYPEDNELKLITTIEEKAELLEEFGIDYLIILPFTKSLSRLSAYNFISDILVEKIGINTIIIGYDHRFGKNREGSIKDIEANASKFSYEVEQIPEQDIEDCIVSSSLIRKSLLNGDIEQANTFLGHAFGVKGIVVDGEKKGTELGYPTANIKVSDPFKLIPRQGVYAVHVRIGQNDYNGMLNAGTRPTFKLGKLAIEVHLFGFSEDIYGQEIEILFVKRWRDERKFESLNALKQQLAVDKEEISAYLE